MPQRVSKETLFLNADKTKLVKEGDPDAAFLFVREGSAVNESEAARLERSGVKLNLKTEDTVDLDIRALHEEQHAGETEAQAKAKRAALGNKAVKAPPEDK